MSRYSASTSSRNDLNCRWLSLLARMKFTEVKTNFMTLSRLQPHSLPGGRLSSHSHVVTHTTCVFLPHLTHPQTGLLPANGSGNRTHAHRYADTTVSVSALLSKAHCGPQIMVTSFSPLGAAQARRARATCSPLCTPGITQHSGHFG